MARLLLRFQIRNFRQFKLTRSKVIFHVRKEYVKDLYASAHLAPVARLRDIVLSQGGEVEVRERDQRFYSGESDACWDWLNPNDLHILQGGLVPIPNVLNTALSYISPYFSLSHHGIQSNGPAVDTAYFPETIEQRAADAFWDKLQNKFVKSRKSRYAQIKEHTEIADGAIAVFLQGSVPENQGSAYCTTRAMLRTVAKFAGHRQVVVKKHPLSNLERQQNMIDELIEDGVKLTPLDANIHDILQACSVTVSMNSAVSVEGMLHNKPAILFGKSDFHHVCETVRNTNEFSAALKRALASAHNYPKYLYWYFNTFCLSLDQPDLKTSVLRTFDEMGFDAKRLALHTYGSDKFVRKELIVKAAVRSIEQTLRTKSEVKSYEILRSLKTASKNWVFSAKINGEKVVVKRFFDSNPARTVGNLKQELEFADAQLGDGPYQVNRCLYDWPEDGMVVLTHVPGLRVQDKIADSNGGQRRRLFKECGNWLKLYTEPRQRSANFNHQLWMERLRTATYPEDMLPEDVDLTNNLFNCLKDQRERVQFQPLTHVASHGDFAGSNVHYHSGVVYGVDIQGEYWVPLVKEVARFLVWQQLHDLRDTTKFRYGIAHEDFQSFLSSDVLAASEQKTILPFVIGAKLHDRFTKSYSSAPQRQLARSAIKAYIAEING